MLLFYHVRFNISDQRTMTSTNYPHPPMFRNNRICKHMTNFKTYPTPLRVDVINIWFLTGKNFSKKVSGGIGDFQVKYFISFCSTIFFICSTKWNLHDHKKKKIFYTIGEDSFKCLIVLTVLPRGVFRNPIKIYGGSLLQK